jgi:hypothetical protein
MEVGNVTLPRDTTFSLSLRQLILRLLASRCVCTHTCSHFPLLSLPPLSDRLQNSCLLQPPPTTNASTSSIFFPHLSPHRFVGYLEEEAVKTYTEIMGAIDTPNGQRPAPTRVENRSVATHSNYSPLSPQPRGTRKGPYSQSHPVPNHSKCCLSTLFPTSLRIILPFPHLALPLACFCFIRSAFQSIS